MSAAAHRHNSRIGHPTWDNMRHAQGAVFVPFKQVAMPPNLLFDLSSDSLLAIARLYMLPICTNDARTCVRSDVLQPVSIHVLDPLLKQFFNEFRGLLLECFC